MGSQHFEEWMFSVLQIAAVPNHSVIELDQAPYHKRQTDETKNLTTAWGKSEIISWQWD
jgi:hypothetical protein